MITEDVLNRILAERDKAHAHELARLQAEHKAQSLEARLTTIEKKMEEAEKDEGGAIGGFKLADIIQAYAMYQQTQQTQSK